MTRRRLTDDQVIEAVKKNTSIKATLEHLGMANCGGNFQTIKGYIKRLNLDTSHFCRGEFKRNHIPANKEPLENFLVENSIYSRPKLKTRLIKENIIPYKCAICGNTGEWEGKELSLHLDHINGVRNDDRLENLRFLCPNCHSQTDTYCGKANRKYHEEKLCACGKRIGKTANECLECFQKNRPHPTKIEWPPKEKILEMVENSSYMAVGKKLGVSDNAIRKHLKKDTGGET